MNVVSYVNGDGWVGLYVNGQLVEQGHKIDPRNLLEHVANLERFTAESIIPNQQWLDDRGMLPNRLEEVVT